MNLKRLDQILDQASEKRFLVIGDLMLDEFVWGKVGRISPEAPVPVVEVTGESFYPGGAANVARNLREFAANVSVLGMVGKDRSGVMLRDLLADQEIDTSNCIEDERICTIVKTRIIARNQQVVRVDRERVINPSLTQIEKIVKTVAERISELDAIIFEDYGKGFLVNELIAQIARVAQSAGKILTADPNPRNLVDWNGMTAIKPNQAEALMAAKITAMEDDKPPDQDADLTRAGTALLEKWNAKYLLITLGEKGMMLFQTNDKPHHIPTKARQVFDVSGAGDTAIALFTLALVGQATPLEAAQIANYASAVAVGKLGTATVGRQELAAYVERDMQHNSK